MKHHLEEYFAFQVGKRLLPADGFLLALLSGSDR
jgi:hypothetical protein